MLKIFCTFVLITMSSSCFAHNVAHQVGLTSGILHPLLGLDHLIAMLAVGILSYQMKKGFIWKLPLAFVVFMCLGGIWGIFSTPMIIVELGIALSLVTLGIMIFKHTLIPRTLALAIVSMFAIFHGYAHGIEIPSLTSPTIYIVGFICSTITLHIAGILLAKYCSKLQTSLISLQHIGSVIFMIGCYFLTNI